MSKNKDLVVKENEVATWDDKKWEAIKKMIIPPGVSDTDVQIFLELSKAYQLHPLKREIFIIPYGNKAQIFCSRDGFLSIAHRSGMFNGISTDFGCDRRGDLQWAECTVYNKSCEHPIKCKVFLKEYTTDRNLWASKPYVMLQKVAESSALRRAFNINGLYSPEEFGDSQSTNDTVNDSKETQKKIETPKKVDKTEEEVYNAALSYIESAGTLDTVAKAKKKIDSITFIEEPARLSFLDDTIVKQIEKIIEPMSWTDDVLNKLNYILENYSWVDNHVASITQMIIKKGN